MIALSALLSCIVPLSCIRHYHIVGTFLVNKFCGVEKFQDGREKNCPLLLGGAIIQADTVVHGNKVHIVVQNRGLWRKSAKKGPFLPEACIVCATGWILNKCIDLGRARVAPLIHLTLSHQQPLSDPQKHIAPQKQRCRNARISQAPKK